MVLGARHKFTDSRSLRNRTTPRRINTKTHRYIKVKLLKTKDKEKSLKNIQRKKRHSMKRTVTRMLVNFSSETMKYRGQWNDIFKY